MYGFSSFHLVLLILGPSVFFQAFGLHYGSSYALLVIVFVILVVQATTLTTVSES